MSHLHPHEIHKTPKSRLVKVLVMGFFLLIANSAYIYTFHQPSYFYYLNVVVHILLGCILLVPFLFKGWQFVRNDAHFGKGFGQMMGYLGYFLLILASATGLYILVRGKLTSTHMVFLGHMVFGVAGSFALISSIRRAGYQISVDNVYATAGRWGLVVFTSFGMLVILGHALRWFFPTTNHTIVNYVTAQKQILAHAHDTLEYPFFPSPAKTSSGEITSSDFLDDSRSCGQSGCHVDIHAQWQQSRHRQTSIRELWQHPSSRLEILKADSNAANYCAGCHMPAALFSGVAREKIPAGDFGNSDVGCTSCHAMKRVDNTLGNANFVIQRPAFYQLSSTKNPILQKFYSALLHLDPEPHSNFYLKPFMRHQTSEFCSSCHKISPSSINYESIALANLDVYDSWQASSFAGARVSSMLSQAKSKDCASCHMPQVASADPANVKGKVHDHSFRHPKSAGKADDALTLDVTAIRRFDGALPVFPAQLNPATEIKIASARLDSAVAADFRTQVVQMPAAERVQVARGKGVRLDVTLRSQGIGHSFPATSLNNRETWIDVEARDRSGRVVYRSGSLNDYKRVEDGAILVGRRFADADGRAVDAPHDLGLKRLVFDRRVPPRSASVFAYAFLIPPSAEGEVQVDLKLKQANQKFRGDSPAGNGAATNGDHEASEAQSAARILAQTRIVLDIIDAPAHPVVRPQPGAHDADRLQNYGIGLFRRGEIEAARQAFELALALHSSRPELWLNMARISLLTGQYDTALQEIDRALFASENNPQAMFYKARTLRAKGQLNEAYSLMKKIAEHYTSDLVFQTELGSLQLQLDKLGKASQTLNAVLAFAPDHAETHKLLQQTYLKRGMEKEAEIEAKIYKKLVESLPGEASGQE